MNTLNWTARLSGGIVIVGCMGMSGCPSAPKATDIEALRNCLGTDFLAADQIRYVGPTTEGAGSIWVKLDNKSIAIGIPAESIVGKPPSKDLVVPSAPGGANCKIDAAAKLDLTASIGTSVEMLPISGELKAGLKNSKIESVVVSGFQLEDVYVLNYEAALLEKTKANPALLDRVKGGDVLGAIRMVKVASYAATLDVTSAVDASVAVKYKGPLPGGLKGELSPAVNLGQSSNGKLTLDIPGTVYVAGVFRPVTLNGLGLKFQSGLEAAPVPKVDVSTVPTIETAIKDARSTR